MVLAKENASFLALVYLDKFDNESARGLNKMPNYVFQDMWEVMSVDLWKMVAIFL